MLAIAIIHRDHSDSAEEAVRLFEDITIAAGYKFRQVELPREALRMLRAQTTAGNSRSLVLWCTRRRDADMSIPDTIAALSGSRRNSEVIVYANADQWSGTLAISCIKKGARDFLVDGIHSRIFSGQVELAISGRKAYGRYQVKLTPGTPAFIATSYTLASHHDRHNGIYPSLEALGVRPFESIDERGTSHVLETVKSQIDQSGLVIANVSLYGGGHNPNVALEIGYALRRQIEPIIIQSVADKDNIYSDLRGIRLLRYHHCSDLAVQLFVGLRDCIA